MKAYIVDMILTQVWNAILFCGLAYLIFWRGQSGWWFLLMFVFGANINKETKEKMLSEKGERG